MNTYLYPWHDLNGNNQIGYVVAKSFISCKEKLSKYLILPSINPSIIYGIKLGFAPNRPSSTDCCANKSIKEIMQPTTMLSFNQ